MWTLLVVGLALSLVEPIEPPKPAALFHCEPGRLRVGYGAYREVSNPIASALEQAGPGSRIEVGQGAYPPLWIGYDTHSANNARTAGGTPGRPIVLRAIGKVSLLPRGASDTISVSQEIKNGYIVFDGLKIHAGYRSAVIFTQGWVHPGFEFRDCTITGNYDHRRQQGASAKWGVQAYGLKDFVFRGVDGDAVIQNIKYEHAFYLHNSQGDVLIERVKGSRLGRTFIQVTSRPGEGGLGTGTITVRDCTVSDVCISPGDDYKGGSAFTFAGPHRGTILIDSCRLRAGFVEELRRLTKPGVPYGTGALVVYGTEAGTVDRLIVKDSDFRFQEGCGDRPLVTIGDVGQFFAIGTNLFRAGGEDKVALRFEGSSPLEDRLFDPSTDLVGRVEVGRREATDAERRSVGLR